MSKFFISCFLILGMCACAPSSQQKRVEDWLAESKHPKVLCTTAIVGDMVREIGGSEIEVLVLIGNCLDPHSYELVKGDDEKIQSADLIFYNGLGLEHGGSLRRFLAQSAKSYAVGDAIAQRHPELVIYVDEQLDPHIWMDVSLWAVAAPIIADQLSAFDPSSAPLYQSRAQEVASRLRLLDEELRLSMAQVPVNKRYLVTSHDSCNYFSRRYLAPPEEQVGEGWRKRCSAPEGLAPESQLSIADIQKVLDHLIAYQIEVVFPESNLNRDALRKLVDAGEQRGLNISLANEALYGDAMGDPGSSGDTYEKMMQHNVFVIKRNLLGSS